MFNLNDIIQAAQGGSGITNLAQQFGLSPEQVQAAVNSMVPGLSAGLQNKAQDATGMGQIISALTNGAHQQTFQTPGPAAAAPGGDILGQIFGSPHVTNQIAQQAAGQTGLRPDILMQMMPAVMSMIMGGMFKSMQSQGMGGMLGQLTNAAGGAGGLGGILGQVMGAQGMGGQTTAGSPQSTGGLGALLASIFGGLFGGGAAKGPALPGGLSGPAVQAGIDALSKMMQPGIQVAAGHQSAIQDILGQMMKAGSGTR